MPVRGWVLSGRRLRFCRRRFDETTDRTRPEDRRSDAGNAATEGCFAGKPGKGKKASRPTCQAKIAEPEESSSPENGSNSLLSFAVPSYAAGQQPCDSAQNCFQTILCLDSSLRLPARQIARPGRLPAPGLHAGGTASQLSSRHELWAETNNSLHHQGLLPGYYFSRYSLKII